MSGKPGHVTGCVHNWKFQDDIITLGKFLTLPSAIEICQHLVILCPKAWGSVLELQTSPAWRWADETSGTLKKSVFTQ